MVPPKSRNIVVMVTAPNEDNALTIARALVEERLAACANLLGAIRSIYRWHDKVEDGREQLLVIKTRSHLFEALQSRVKQLHPYEVPEIIALPIDQGSKPYLDWLQGTTAPQASNRAHKPPSSRPTAKRSRA